MDISPGLEKNKPRKILSHGKAVVKKILGKSQVFKMFGYEAIHLPKRQYLECILYVFMRVTPFLTLKQKRFMNKYGIGDSSRTQHPEAR